VDILLVGHDHIYERLAPMAPTGAADPIYGVRQFTLGTGGAEHQSFNTILPTSEVRNNDTWGVMKLTLHDTSYDWVFLPVDGGTFTDSGTGVTHGPPPDQPPIFDQDLPDRTDAEGAAISLFSHASDANGDSLTYAASGLPPGLTINSSTGLISGTISAGAATGSPYAVNVTVSDDGGATVGATDTFSWSVATASGSGLILFRSASFAANSVGNNVVIPTPAGVQADDIMIAVLDVKAAPTVTTPSGWTLVSTTPNGSNFKQVVYSRVVTASEPVSTTWTINENRAISGGIVAYSGVNTSTPVETFSAGTGSTTSITAPSVTSAFAGAMIVGAFGINADSTIAPPPGMTERGEIVSAARIRTEISDVALTTAGATGAKTATAATAAANIGQLVVLRPMSSLANTSPVAHDVTATATAGIAKTITLVGADAETCELTFGRAAATLDSGASVSAPTSAACTGSGPFEDTATVTYTASTEFSGSDSFTYTVHDGTAGSNTATVSITVAPFTPNAPPTFDQDLPDRTDAEGAAISLSSHAGDPNGDSLTYSASGLPPGLSINASTGLISGTISTGAATDSPYAANVTVSDDGGATVGAIDTFSWSVTTASGSGSIEFRSASFAANTIAKTVVIPAPAGVRPGDVMLAVLDVKTIPTVTTPAGWTFVAITRSGSKFEQAVYARIVTASESSSYQWTLSAKRAACGGIVAYSGVNTSTPVETFSAATGSTASITAPSVTSAFGGAMIVGAFGINADATIAPPPGMIERGEIVSASRIRTEISDVALAIAGATGSKTATAALAAANIGQLVVLRPA